MNASKMILTVNDEQQLEPAAKTLLQQYPGQRIFAFYGEMGVGKTTFIKSICKVLGVQEVVDSPTFSIVNQYKSDSGEQVFHFDFYRIKKLEEVFDLGYEDYFYSGAYCLIEWPEKMQALLPEDCVMITMQEQDTKRIIEF